MMDSNYTNHMYFDREEFTNYFPYHAAIIVANEANIYTQGRGIVEIK